MVDFSLGQTGNFVAAALTGYAAGQQIGRERRTQQALGAYQADPEGAIQQAYSFDPQLGDQLSSHYARTQLGESLAQTAKPELAQFARINPEAYQKFNAQQMEQVAKANEYLGNAALRISRLPEAERATAWDSAVDQAGSFGLTGAAKYKGKYNTDLLESLIDQTNKTAAYLKAKYPNITVTGLGNGASLIQRDSQIYDQNTGQWVDISGTGQPTAQPATPADTGPNQPHITVDQMGAIGKGVDFTRWQQRERVPVLAQTEADYRKLPSGTLFIAPDGSVRTKK